MVAGVGNPHRPSESSKTTDDGRFISQAEPVAAVAGEARLAGSDDGRDDPLASIRRTTLLPVSAT